MYKKWLGLEFERVEGARLPPLPPTCTPLISARPATAPGSARYSTHTAPTPTAPTPPASSHTAPSPTASSPAASADERLRIVFTHVDPQAPTRAFTFYVYVDSSDRYHGAATPAPRPPPRPAHHRAPLAARAEKAARIARLARARGRLSALSSPLSLPLPLPDPPPPPPPPPPLPPPTPTPTPPPPPPPHPRRQRVRSGEVRARGARRAVPRRRAQLEQ